MKYNSGNGEIIPTEGNDPTEFVNDFSLITFNAPVSHPHMALEVGCEVFVPDLVRFRFIEPHEVANCELYPGC